MTVSPPIQFPHEDRSNADRKTIAEQERRIAVMQARLSEADEATRSAPAQPAEVSTFQRDPIIGSSPALKRVLHTVEKVAGSEASVLIHGPSGTGKELLAQALHDNSQRRDGPLVTVHSAALSPSLLESELFGHRKGAFTGADEQRIGLFEVAHGGTLFLDEIGDVSQTVQTSMLRVLEEGEIVRLGDSLPRKVDVRVICTTNGSLYRRLESGEFRKDLLYRLKVARILVPPLCERRDDLPLLIEAFLAEVRAETGKGLTGFTSDAMMHLMSYEWPGNVRELRNVITYVAIHCKDPIAGLGDLPPELLGLETPPPNLNKTVREPVGERKRTVAALEICGGNRTRAAGLLGISRATLYGRLETFGIN